MSERNKLKIFLVDDDALYLKDLEIEFSGIEDFEVYTFSTGEICLGNIAFKPDFVILDYYLNSVYENAINGIQTLDAIKKYSPFINVIILSSQDQIEVAVDCMHHQALDYVVKSDSAFLRLRKIIASKIQLDKISRELKWYMDTMKIINQ